MCFKTPKPPKPSSEQVAAERDAALQREQALSEQRSQRADNKRARFRLALGRAAGGVGRSSLLTGAGGGAGYAAPSVRSLLSVGG